MGSLEKSEYPGNTPGLFKKALEALCGQYRHGQGIKAELAAEWGPVMFGVPAGKFQSSYSATDFPGLSGVAPATCHLPGKLSVSCSFCTFCFLFLWGKKVSSFKD